jgi:hypothetical protein
VRCYYRPSEHGACNGFGGSGSGGAEVLQYDPVSFSHYLYDVVVVLAPQHPVARP